MPKYLGALTIVLLLAMVLTRVFLLKRQGVTAMKFGSIDSTDFLIPPFAFFYFYVLFAATFDWPNVSKGQLFHSEPPHGSECCSALRASPRCYGA
jgi:hypothetical protein